LRKLPLGKEFGMDFLWDEDTPFEDVVTGYQGLINTGQAWLLEGHVGRTAMGLIESGHCMLGKEAHTDYWGNRVPSRYEVEDGTKGSPSFVRETLEREGLGHLIEKEGTELKFSLN
jgi:hypothetical protein